MNTQSREQTLLETIRHGLYLSSQKSDAMLGDLMGIMSRIGFKSTGHAFEFGLRFSVI